MNQVNYYFLVQFLWYRNVYYDLMKVKSESENNNIELSKKKEEIKELNINIENLKKEIEENEEKKKIKK